jgi:hypothetical protein
MTNAQDKWNDMPAAQRGNWLAAHSYAYSFQTYSFTHLPRHIQEHFAKRAPRVCIDCYSTHPEPHANNCPTKTWTT